MMDAFKLILLGVLQGLTEFLPISSSGHLAIAQKILGINEGLLQITVTLHLGTLLALFVYFFKDILAALKDIRLIKNILIVTIVTGLIGITGKDFFESLFSSIRYVSAALFFTAFILFLSRRYLGGKKSLRDVGVGDSLLLGIAQGIAIIPGISRSGLTISALLFRGFDRIDAFRYSFLASIPAVIGAFLIESGGGSLLFSRNVCLGFLASFLSGLAALKILKTVLAKAKWYLFGYYCIILASVILIISLF